MSDSGQKFIRRKPRPRVHISYEDPHDAERQVELPFVMGILSDLSGNDPGVEKADIAERKFLESRHGQFREPHGRDRSQASPSRWRTSSAETPTRSCRSTSASRRWRISARPRWRGRFPRSPSCLSAREQLSNLLSYMDGKAAASDQLKALLSDPQLMAALGEIGLPNGRHRRKPRRALKTNSTARFYRMAKEAKRQADAAVVEDPRRR